MKSSVNTIRVLLIEDDDDHAALIMLLAAQIGPSFCTITRAASLTEGLKLLIEQSFEIIILDLGLPETKGIETFRRISQEQRTIPIVILTSKNDIELGSQAVHEGAQDYLAKENLTADVLERSLRYSLERARYITNLQVKTDELQVSLNEQAVLLKEVHHRVKNNLQLISSLLNLQSMQTNNESVKHQFESISSRIAAMAFVHEQLYQSNTLSRINAAEYIRLLTGAIALGYTAGAENEIKFEVEKVLLPINMAIPFGLIVNELVTNSIKHAFTNKNKGEIRISLKQNESDEVILEVSDNGVGFPKDFNSEQSKSLGIRLINDLSRQLHGKCENLSGENGGSKFRLTFRNVEEK